MRKKIVIGSLLAVCSLMMLPSISAIEYKTTTETAKADVMEQIKHNYKIVKEKIRENLLSKNTKEIDPQELLELLYQVLKLLVILLPLLIILVQRILGPGPAEPSPTAE